MRTLFAAFVLFCGWLAATTSAGTLPSAFSLGNVVDVAPESLVTSELIRVRGIDRPIAISVTGGQYAINGGDFTDMAGTVLLGNQVQLRLQAPEGYGQSAVAELTLGSLKAQFNVTTQRFQALNAVSQVFDAAPTDGLEIEDGVLRITQPPSVVLQLSANALQDAVVVIKTSEPVLLRIGTSVWSLSRRSSNCVLQVAEVAGLRALVVIFGSALIETRSVDAGIAVASGAAGSAALRATAVGAQAIVGRDAERNVVAAVLGTQALQYRNFGRSGTLSGSFTVYPGETVTTDASGEVGQLRLGSFAQDDDTAVNSKQAGDYLVAGPLQAPGLRVPIISGISQRFPETPAKVIARELAERLQLGTNPVLTQNPSNGVVTLRTDSKAYRFLPVGPLRINFGRNRAVNTTATAANLTEVVGQSLSFAVAPAASYDSLLLALQAIDPLGATLTVLRDGVVRASVGGSVFLAQPAAELTPSTSLQAAIVPFNGTVAVQDGSGYLQPLYAAFADTDALTTVLREDVPLPSTSVSNTGLGQYRAQIDSVSIRLLPDLSPTIPDPAFAASTFWFDPASGKYFVRYPDNSAQGFGVLSE